jgi:hypothetical protein
MTDQTMCRMKDYLWNRLSTHGREQYMHWTRKNKGHVLPALPRAYPEGSGYNS